MKQWRCTECNNIWDGNFCLCTNCGEIGYEIMSKDVLDVMEIISLDEALEEIEGKDDESNVPI